MKKMIILGLVALQIYSVFARAEKHDKPVDAEPAQEQQVQQEPPLITPVEVVDQNEIQLSQAESMLEADIISSESAGGLKTLSKPLRLYSYFNAYVDPNTQKLWPTYQSTSTRKSQALADISSYAGAFWNLNNHTTKLVNGGPGMYLAIDPVISKTYGHSNYSITFQPGTKIINVSDPTWKHVSQIKLRSETIKALISENIISKSDISKLGMQNGYFSRVGMQNIAAEGNEKYRDMMMRIFEKNNITMVEYTWEKSKLGSLCKKTSSSAFVYIGSRPKNSQTSEYVQATVSDSVVDNAVFRSSYSVEQYEAKEIEVNQQVNLLQNVIEGQQSSKDSSIQEELKYIKSLSYQCE